MKRTNTFWWFCLALLIRQQTTAQGIYPVQVTVQLLPPYSVYLADYASAGNERLRLVLLQKDLTQASYPVRLVVSIEWNGRVIMRTARSYNPPPLSLQPGLPTVISGADLAPYLESANLEFVGYSREQYERTRALPEGSYAICVTAYDYQRPEVALSSPACSFYFLAKSEPPLLNYPSCGSKIPSRQPQQIIFSWMPRNTASANSAASTEYAFQLYERRPPNRNPNDVVATTAPIYETTTSQTTLVYGPAEPLLLDSMQYVWRVQAKDTEGKDAFRNRGYSEVCPFTYGATEVTFTVGAVQDFAAQARAERKATMSWRKDSSTFEGYRLEYKKKGQGYQWFSTDTKESAFSLFDLEPNTEYETRVQGRYRGVAGPWSELVSFRTPEARVIQCGATAPAFAATPAPPLPFATTGMIINARGMEVILEEVEHLPEEGFYRGTGRVSIPYLAGASFALKFDRIYIDAERNVGAGKIEVLSRGVAAMSQQQLANQQQRQRDRQQQANREKYKDYEFYENITLFDDIVISAVSPTPEGGMVIQDEGGQTYSDPALNALLAGEALGKALVIEDRNGDQWLVKPDRTVEKVPGGGLPPLQGRVSREALDVVKKALRELRNEYDEQRIASIQQSMTAQQQALEQYIQRQNQQYASGPIANPTTSSTTTPFISENFVEVPTTATNDEFKTQYLAYKQAEREHNRALVIAVCARENNSQQEYTLVADGLDFQGKKLTQYLSEQKQAGKTESVMVGEIKEAIVVFIEKMLNEYVYTPRR